MNISKKLKKIFSQSSLSSSLYNSNQTHTRTLSPKLGLLGLLGFIGFLGFIPALESAPSPFFFFAFFGFFGFYYEGKMSHTLIDEHFKINAYRAEALAHKIGLLIIIISSTIFIGRLSTPKATASFLIAIIGLAWGLIGFLQYYLLYRFENEE